MKWNVKDLNKVFDAVMSEAFVPVAKESGWRVVIDNVWVRKTDISGTPKRVYASRNAAKDRIEEEFSAIFRRMFRQENKQVIEDCWQDIEVPVDHWKPEGPKRVGRKCKDRETLEAIEISCLREFRRWMNELYKSGRVRFVEV